MPDPITTRDAGAWKDRIVEAGARGWCDELAQRQDAAGLFGVR